MSSGDKFIGDGDDFDIDELAPDDGDLEDIDDEEEEEQDEEA